MYVSACPSAVNFLGKWEILIGDIKYLSDFSHRCHMRSRDCVHQHPQEVPAGARPGCDGCSWRPLPREHRGRQPASGRLHVILHLIQGRFHFIPKLKGGCAKDVSDGRMLAGRHGSVLPHGFQTFAPHLGPLAAKKG